MASCIPKHIQRYGIFFSRANLIASIFHSIHEVQNPPGTIIQSTHFNIFIHSFSISFEFIHFISTFVSKFAQA
ncbi:MAG: hypothetical protein LBQ59_03125 [Candidatus Peribacteria bacterium]|jgi:hypothetical protein|nr:hypothetical protein [Candidatus Peribacteria bacterium]